MRGGPSYLGRDVASRIVLRQEKALLELEERADTGNIQKNVQ